MTENQVAAGSVAEPVSAELLIDVDGHNLPTLDDLKCYMPTRWSDYLDDFGWRTPSPELGIVRARWMGSRTDSWSPSGKPPGADVEYFCEQLLDRYGYDAIVLNNIMAALQGFNGGAAPQEFTNAIMRATNSWAADKWIDADERFYSSIVLPLEDARAAVDEFEQWAGHPRFVGVVVPFRTHAPIGNRKYWDIIEVAVDRGLPLGFHPGNGGNVPLTGAGFPSFYFEDHTGLAHALATQMASLVCEGVFDRWPELKILVMEGGWTWVPAYADRFDTAWSQLRGEVSHLQRRPSEYIRDHFWYSTQPMEEPEQDHHLGQALEAFGAPERIMFSSDYPHWDFDPPSEIARLMPDEMRDGVMGRNAARFYPKLAHFDEVARERD